MRFSRGDDVSRCLYPQGCVVAVGNFDGMHRGHLQVLNAAMTHAVSRQLPAVVVGFSPLPHEYFSLRRGIAPPSPRLNLVRDKAPILRALGIERLLLLRFDARLCRLSAADFVARYLIGMLNARLIVVGEDFRCGRHRQADTDDLQRLMRGFGGDAVIVPTLRQDGHKLSSTALRHVLCAGRFRKASDFLGRPYVMRGRVGHGRKLGRALGCPTANIYLSRFTPPLIGVFASRVRGAVADKSLPAVSYINSVDDAASHRYLLETHLIDFEGDLYGRRLQVEFAAKLRDYRSFAGLSAAQIKRQIGDDIGRAMNWHHEHSSLL